ncbi:MAG: efflux RND transporter periplasmic adaptor subunit [Bacteroidales bacterium]|jgi:HlyD family secretion protein|nr:efflux RND transporter periplasmic adaptor subunit [Bacteroidales bacterium]
MNRVNKSLRSSFVLMLACVLFACENSNNKYDASGVFEATEVIVSAKANGEIIMFNLQEGATVEKDSVIGLIDTTQLYLKKLQLQAALSAANSRQIDVPSQIAAMQEQLKTLEREKKRFQTLVNNNVANQKQLDDINSSIAALRKQMSAQKEQMSNANSSISGEAESIEAQIAQVEDMLQQSIIKSPVSGTVLVKYAERGELAAAGKPLFKVADLSTMYLRAYIVGSQMSEIKTGQQVKVYSDRGENESNEHKGIVSWISDKAEFTPKTIQTRDERSNLVYPVKIAVSNDSSLIKQGMYGEVDFKGF